MAGLVAALTAPIFSAVTPASAAVLFTCPGIDSSLDESNFGLMPGLSHTQTAQDAWYDYVQIYNLGVCSNGQQLYIAAGTGVGNNPVTTFPTRPLGCPVAWGGAGPDYPNQMPILFGGTDPSFDIFWYGTSTTSTGITKVKQGAAGDQWKLVFNITAGEYAPPAGKKTKIKFTAVIAPYPGYSYSCADDSDPLEYVKLTSVGQVVVNQK
jgi:hypothetical protein